MLRVEGKQNPLFPMEPVIKCFVTKYNKLCGHGEKSYALGMAGHKFAAIDDVLFSSSGTLK